MKSQPATRLIRLRFWLAVLAPVAPATAWWAKRIESRGAVVGRPLDAREVAMATGLGVCDPARVRVILTPHLPLPGPAWLHRLLKRLGFPASETVGLCLGHSIFIHPTWALPAVLAHELVHTAQCERLGGLRAFLHQYFAECLTHGYLAAPMEVEARSLSDRCLPTTMESPAPRSGFQPSINQPSAATPSSPVPSATSPPPPPTPDASPPPAADLSDAPAAASLLRWFLSLSLPLYVLDQLTKWWTVARFDDPDTPGFQVRQFFGRTLNDNPSTAYYHETIEVIPGFFWLHRLHNTGIAFGRFNGGAWSNYIFGTVSLAAFLAVTWMWRRHHFPTLLGKLAASLLLSGIIGNLTDRLVHGYVVDFLRFRLGHLYARLTGDPFFPSFNIADSCITTAAVLLLLSSFQKPHPPSHIQN